MKLSIAPVGLALVVILAMLSACTSTPSSAAPTSAAVAAVASPAAASASAATPVRITAAAVTSGDAAIAIQNSSGSAVDLTGWKLRAGSATATLPSGARVPANDSVTIHTSAGTSTGRDIYLGQDAAALLQALRPGTTIALLDAQGNTVGDFRLPG